MIAAQAAVDRLRRGLAIGAFVRGTLVALVAGALLTQVLAPSLATVASVLLAAAGGLWLALSFASLKGSRLAAASPALIAAGDYERAEQAVEQALAGFSLFRSTQLRALHNLARLRHAQRRHAEAAFLGHAVLSHRLGAGLEPVARATRLLLADALIELGDLAGAHAALDGLFGQRLSLAEALDLLVVQSDYLARVGAWERLMEGVERKAALAELMPSARAARTQAILALAARRLGRGRWERWLRRRAELLEDPAALRGRLPALAELWPAGGAA